MRLKNLIILSAFFVSSAFLGAQQRVNLLHVSFDISREVFQAINEGFRGSYTRNNPGVQVTIEQSHAGSSRQAQAVADGLPADLVSMNQFVDIDYIADKSQGRLIPQNWQSLLPQSASPFSSTMTFVVRKGNPKGIKDWSDLIRPGVRIVVPHLQSTGNGRYTYLSAYAYALQQNKGNHTLAREFVKKLLQNIPQFATGGRDATTIFVEREQGDVLITFEAESNQIIKNFARGDYEQVIPSYGLETKIYVASVNPNLTSKNAGSIAQAYWNFIYSDAGQEIIAKNFFRPNNASILARYRSILPELKLQSVETVFGSWDEAQKTHFDQGGIFAQLIRELGRN